MGYRGKLAERERARQLRAQAWTLKEIAEHLGVSKSSVSVWVRDVEFTPRPRHPGQNGGAQPPRPHAQRERKLAQIDLMNELGRERTGALTRRDALIAGVALDAGEGTKTDGDVAFANTDAGLMRFFCRWLRTFFEVDEDRLRVRLYLHQGLDLEAATVFWSTCTGVPASQFGKPYRAAADPTLRTAKHRHGCATVSYSCSATHREIMGLVRALPAAPWSAIDR